MRHRQGPRWVGVEERQIVLLFGAVSTASSAKEGAFFGKQRGEHAKRQAAAALLNHAAPRRERERSKRSTGPPETGCHGQATAPPRPTPAVEGKARGNAAWAVSVASATQAPSHEKT